MVCSINICRATQVIIFWYLMLFRSYVVVLRCFTDLWVIALLLQALLCAVVFFYKSTFLEYNNKYYMYFSYFQVDVLEKRHFCLFSESKIQENDACLCYLY